MNWKNNIPLIVGLALPVLMIVFVAVSIYLPQMGGGAVPQYDFLYMTQGGGVNTPPGVEKYYYGVEGDKLTRQEVATTMQNPKDPTAPTVVPAGKPIETAKFYIYDTKQNTSREVTFADAEKLVLDSRMVSQDSFEITQGNNNGSIFTEIFGGNRDYGSWYISGHGKATKLILVSQPGSYGYFDFRFLGWITQK